MKNIKRYIILLSALFSSWFAFGMEPIQFAAGLYNGEIIIREFKDSACKHIQTLNKVLKRSHIESLVFEKKSGFLVPSYYSNKYEAPIFKKDENNTFIQISDSEVDKTLYDLHFLYKSIKHITESKHYMKNKNIELYCSISGMTDTEIKINQYQGNDPSATPVSTQILYANSGGHLMELIFDEKRGLLFSGSTTGTIKIWQIQEDNTFKHIQTIDKNVSEHTCICSLELDKKNGLLFSGSDNGIIKIWQRQKDLFTCIHTIKEKSGVRALAIIEDKEEEEEKKNMQSRLSYLNYNRDIDTNASCFQWNLSDNISDNINFTINIANQINLSVTRTLLQL